MLYYFIIMINISPLLSFILRKFMFDVVGRLHAVHFNILMIIIMKPTLGYNYNDILWHYFLFNFILV